MASLGPRGALSLWTLESLEKNARAGLHSGYVSETSFWPASIDPLSWKQMLASLLVSTVGCLESLSLVLRISWINLESKRNQSQ